MTPGVQFPDMDVALRHALAAVGDPDAIVRVISAAGYTIVEAGMLHGWRAALDAVSDELGALGD